jgi:hypothetical protein
MGPPGRHSDQRERPVQVLIWSEILAPLPRLGGVAEPRILTAHQPAIVSRVDRRLPLCGAGSQPMEVVVDLCAIVTAQADAERDLAQFLPS